MPKRMLSESICTSENLDKLTQGAEILFYRLLVKCDDFGRFDGRPAIIRSSCYPLKMEDENPRVKTIEVVQWLKELETQNLLTMYQVEGLTFLQITTWETHQRMRAKFSKYPAPDSTCRHLTSIDDNCARDIQLRYSTSKNKLDKNDPDKFRRGKLGHMVET